MTHQSSLTTLVLSRVSGAGCSFCMGTRIMAVSRVAPSKRRVIWILGVIISLLALADGALHFALDFVLFHGRLWGSFRPSGPPPGGPGRPPPVHAGPPPGPHFSLPLPLNELFVLNAIGYIVLVIAFWLGGSLLGRWRWLIDAAIAVYAAFSIWAWFEFGA